MCYDNGVVPRLSYGKDLPRTSNKRTSLVDTDMGSNPICSNFYGLDPLRPIFKDMHFCN